MSIDPAESKKAARKKEVDDEVRAVLPPVLLSKVNWTTYVTERGLTVIRIRRTIDTQ